MRNITHLLTGTLLFTFIIVGCRESKSPSSPEPTSNPQKNESALPKATSTLTASNESALPNAASTLTASTDVDLNVNIQNSSIKKWGLQVNEDRVTAISYGEDIFMLEEFMTTPNDEVILISANSLTNDSIYILKLTHKSDANLIGYLQKITNPNVIQEITSFTNDSTENIVLDSYVEAETSEEAIFNISFYSASYTAEDYSFFPTQLSANFTHRQRNAYMMIVDTTTAENTYVDVNIVIASTPAPKFPVPINAMRHKEHLYLSFQQSSEDFSTSTPTIALMKGLDIEGYNHLNMNVRKASNNQSIVFTFNRHLQINDRNRRLTIEVTSDMRPLHFSLSLSNVATRAWLKTQEKSQEVIQSDAFQAASSTVKEAAMQYALIKVGQLVQPPTPLYSLEDGSVVRETLSNIQEHSQEVIQSDAFQAALSTVKEAATQYALIKVGQFVQPPTPLYSLENADDSQASNNLPDSENNQHRPYINLEID